MLQVIFLTVCFEELLLYRNRKMARYNIQENEREYETIKISPNSLILIC